MIGEVLGWKHNHHPGIVTRDGAIVEWPAALGPMPDQATLDTWTAEFLAAKPDVEAQRDVDGMKALRAVVRWVAPLVGKTPAQARNEIIAIYKALP